MSGDVGKDQHKEEMAQLYSSSTDRVATLGEKIAQPGLAGSDNTPVVRSVVPHCLWVTSLSSQSVISYLADQLLVRVDIQAAVEGAAFQLVQQDVFPAQQ